MGRNRNPKGTDVAISMAGLGGAVTGKRQNLGIGDKPTASQTGAQLADEHFLG